MNRQDVAVGLVAGLVVGLAVGAAAVGGLGTTRTSSASMTVAAATGCVAPDASATGTVGVLPVADGTVVSLNLTLVHEVPAVNVSTDLAESGGGSYTLAVTASPDGAASARKGEPPADCQPRTTVRAGAFVPGDVRTLRVTYDGTEVAAVAGDGGFAPVPRLNGSRVGERLVGE